MYLLQPGFLEQICSRSLSLDWLIGKWIVELDAHIYLRQSSWKSNIYIAFSYRASACRCTNRKLFGTDQFRAVTRDDNALTCLSNSMLVVSGTSASWCFIATYIYGLSLGLHTHMQPLFSFSILQMSGHPRPYVDGNHVCMDDHVERSNKVAIYREVK